MPCGGPTLSQADIETILRWIPGSEGGGAGDPHFETVDGVHYDFQAAGEFVLLKGENMEIQVRLQPVGSRAQTENNRHTGLASCVSVISGVAMRFGDATINFQQLPTESRDPDDVDAVSSALQLRVNGKVTPLSQDIIEVTRGIKIRPTLANNGFQVESHGDSVLVVTPGWWRHQQLWYLNLDGRHLRGTRGLIGTVAPENWLPALPDGSLLGPKPSDPMQRHATLYGSFGKAWRVLDSTSLFHYGPNQTTVTYTDESWPPPPNRGICTSSPQRAPGMPQPFAPLQPSITRLDAEAMTLNILDPDQRENCIQDLIATGEIGFVETYELAQTIINNQLPDAPTLFAPADYSTGIGSTVEFLWDETFDPDQGQLTYRLLVWPIEERPDNNLAIEVDNRTQFVWEGLQPGKIYRWKVIVEDGQGGTVESVIRRFETQSLEIDQPRASLEIWSDEFGVPNGWTLENSIRLLGDVDGDGKADFVGIGPEGVWVGISKGSAFGPASQWTNRFGDSGGWSTENSIRTLADLNGDKLLDLVGIGNHGIWAAVSNGLQFEEESLWTTAFSPSGGWELENSHRLFKDLNADDRADVIGIGDYGIWVATSNGTSFENIRQWTPSFGTSGGWEIDNSVRTLADLNGDKLPDIVGISSQGVWAALSDGERFGAARQWTPIFGESGGWSFENSLRTVHDLNGDGRADGVGIGSTGLWATVSSGEQFGVQRQWTPQFSDSDGWNMENSHRQLADLNGDNRADLIGFSPQGLWHAPSDGNAFGPATLLTETLSSEQLNQIEDRVRTADVDGDGVTDLVVFTDNIVYKVTMTGTE